MLEARKSEGKLKDMPLMSRRSMLKTQFSGSLKKKAEDEQLELSARNQLWMIMTIHVSIAM